MPGYYLIGTPKCGTTTLYYAMIRHPLVVHPFGKVGHTGLAICAHPTAPSDDSWHANSARYFHPLPRTGSL